MEPVDLQYPVTDGSVPPEAAPRYVLPVFEGPLDLLLYLIQKNEVDIMDIPIARVTDQYLGYLEQMRELNLEIASDFILMAATLIQIKSRVLLPQAALDENGEPLEDPREALVRELQEYQRVKELSQILKEREIMSLAQFTRAPFLEGPAGSGEFMALEVDLYDLVDALNRVLKRASDRRERLVYAQEVSLEECMRGILARLGRHGSLLFTDLFEGPATRLQIVVTFLALLELVKQRRVLLRQGGAFEPIRLATR
ncbi:MAG: segregation/condensation protein A [Acidobacteriota bacterium]